MPTYKIIYSENDTFMKVKSIRKELKLSNENLHFSTVVDLCNKTIEEIITLKKLIEIYSNYINSKFLLEKIKFLYEMSDYSNLLQVEFDPLNQIPDDVKKILSGNYSNIFILYNSDKNSHYSNYDSQFIKSKLFNSSNLFFVKRISFDHFFKLEDTDPIIKAKNNKYFIFIADLYNWGTFEKRRDIINKINILEYNKKIIPDTDFMLSMGSKSYTMIPELKQLMIPGTLSFTWEDLKKVDLKTLNLQKDVNYVIKLGYYSSNDGNFSIRFDSYESFESNLKEKIKKLNVYDETTVIIQPIFESFKNCIEYKFLVLNNKIICLELGSNKLLDKERYGKSKFNSDGMLENKNLSKLILMNEIISKYKIDYKTFKVIHEVFRKYKKNKLEQILLNSKEEISTILSPKKIDNLKDLYLVITAINFILKVHLSKQKIKQKEEYFFEELKLNLDEFNKMNYNYSQSKKFIIFDKIYYLIDAISGDLKKSRDYYKINSEVITFVNNIIGIIKNKWNKYFFARIDIIVECKEFNFVINDINYNKFNIYLNEVEPLGSGWKNSCIKMQENNGSFNLSKDLQNNQSVLLKITENLENEINPTTDFI